MNDNEFAKLVKLLTDGRIDDAEKAFVDAMNDSFTRGEEYAKDTVGEWNRP